MNVADMQLELSSIVDDMDIWYAMVDLKLIPRNPKYREDVVDVMSNLTHELPEDVAKARTLLEELRQMRVSAMLTVFKKSRKSSGLLSEMVKIYGPYALYRRENYHQTTYYQPRRSRVNDFNVVEYLDYEDLIAEDWTAVEQDTDPYDHLAYKA